jgi:hypothetical protein
MQASPWSRLHLLSLSHKTGQSEALRQVLPEDPNEQHISPRLMSQSWSTTQSFEQVSLHKPVDAFEPPPPPFPAVPPPPWPPVWVVEPPLPVPLVVLVQPTAYPAQRTTTSTWRPCRTTELLLMFSLHLVEA